MLRALVLGGAAGVMAEADAALSLFRPDAVFAVNNVIVDWPGRLDYACTLHPEKTPAWPGIEEALRRRERAGRNRPESWAHKPARGIDHVVNDWRGSSGLFAVRVAIHEGFDRIVLAGIPMTPQQPHYFDRRAWTQAGSFHKGWRQYRAQLLPRVRSMSGWTADFLGRPTIEWLAATTPEPGDP